MLRFRRRRRSTICRRTKGPIEIKPVDAFLQVPFRELLPYVQYVGRNARFDTHPGVKGLEFPRVMVIMDDKEARGFQFKYEKLFGAS